ncbi:MAG TPA: hypothetical protein VIE15_03870 [Acidimicrobiales bacterium]
MRAARLPAAITTHDLALAGGLCAAGAAIRGPGLTSRDLWFDDAWAALPAHVALHDAVRMVVTTPLYTLALRYWIIAGPADTWWAQIPALVFGVAGIAGIYLLIRWLGFSRLAAFAAGAVVAASPITVMYSTRVKEYSADLLLACLVLWLFERWRRAPSGPSMAVLGVVALSALWISASTAAAVGGIAAAAVLVAWATPALRRQVLALLAWLAVGSATLWLVFLRHLQPELRANWRRHGFLFGYSSSRHVEYAFQQTFSGIVHGVFGAAIPYTFKGYALRTVPMALAIVTALVLVALVVPPVVAVIRTKGRAASATTAAAATVLLAIAGTVAGIAPLGDGRTDEALYPSMLVLLVACAAGVARALRVEGTQRRVVRAVVAGVVAVGALWFGIAHVAEYPPTGVSSVLSELRASGLLRPGDLLVVDGYESFTWGDEHLGPWAVSFQQGAIPWPMGFHVASLERSVILSRDYLQPDATFPTLSQRSHRLWFIGPTVGGYSTSAPTPLWALPFHTPTLNFFLGPRGNGANGWRPVHPCCGDSGAYAWLFVHQ